jgi:prepilin-type N-terminal cleavage/methylation domain-containing protein
MRKMISIIHQALSTKHNPVSVFSGVCSKLSIKGPSRNQRIAANDASGFTIIELLVATTIFSIVLVVIVASFLQIGRMFYKGVSINNTNEAARSLVDDIANDVRFSKAATFGDPKADPTVTNKWFFCIGQHRYTYRLGVQVKDTDVNTTAKDMQAGVIQDTTGGNCQDPTKSAGINASQILGPDMRLNDLDVVKNATGSAVRIHAHVLFYGVDDQVFNPDVNDAAASCSGTLLSTQFCATSDIDTNITLGF